MGRWEAHATTHTYPLKLSASVKFVISPNIPIKRNIQYKKDATFIQGSIMGGFLPNTAFFPPTKIEVIFLMPQNVKNGLILFIQLTIPNLSLKINT